MIKTSRHQERIWALQILYSMDLTDQMSINQARKAIHDLKEENLLREDRYYFEELIYGVIENIDLYNRQINEQAIDWNIGRMAYVDRNIIRIAVYEMEHEIPVGVVINEAVEIAKEYAGEKSASFINGILAKISQ